MPALYLSDGPLFGTTLVSTFLLGVVAMQASRYWTTFKNDPTILKIAAVLLCVLLFAFNISFSVGVYYYTLSENISVSLPSPLAWKVAAFFGDNTVVIVQIVFIYRVWRFTSKRWMVALVAVLEGFVSAIGLLLDIASARDLPYTGKHVFYSWAYESWFVADCLQDWLITASVVYGILKTRSTASPRTRNLLDKLLVFIVSTGLLPSMLAVGAAISYKFVHDQAIWLMFYAVIPCLYVNSLLFSLNGRTHLRGLENNEDLKLPSGLLVGVSLGQGQSQVQISNIRFAQSTVNGATANVESDTFDQQDTQ